MVLALIKSENKSLRRIRSRRFLRKQNDFNPFALNLHFFQRQGSKQNTPSSWGNHTFGPFQHIPALLSRLQTAFLLLLLLDNGCNQSRSPCWYRVYHRALSCVDNFVPVSILTWCRVGLTTVSLTLSTGVKLFISGGKGRTNLSISIFFAGINLYWVGAAALFANKYIQQNLI